jgi:hypothetical protein
MEVQHGKSRLMKLLVLEPLVKKLLCQSFR